MNKRLLLAGVVAIIFFAACGGFTYHGKFITTEVDQEPMDEFKIGQYVVLAFENTDKNARDSWLYGFNVYYRGEIFNEYFIRAESVGTRRFYLKEVHDKRLITRASFVTEPTYEMAKERMSSYIRSL
ncbi:MAG: hypothetical protein ACLFSQ_02670 [Candidatus Zixiibacteriota bacterium]